MRLNHCDADSESNRGIVEKVGSTIVDVEKKPLKCITFDRLKEMMNRKQKKVKKKSERRTFVIDETRLIRMFIGAALIFLIVVMMISFVSDFFPYIVLLMMVEFGYTGALAALCIFVSLIIMLFTLYMATRTQDIEKEDIEF